MLSDIQLDLMANKNSGLFVKVFLVNFRLGRFFSRRGKAWLPLYYFSLSWHKFFQLLFGCYIPFSVDMAAGTHFVHGFYGVFISGSAVIEKDVVLFHNVTLGGNYGSKKKYGAPHLEEGVFVGAGAIVVGSVNVGKGAIIAAGATVYEDVEPQTKIFPPKAISV